MSIPAIHGFLVVDKPAGITSRAAVDRVGKWFPRKTRIGHSGTLDPLATGILVVCLGKGTRLVECIQRMTKVYLATILLGATSDTDDAEGTITPVDSPAVPTLGAIKEALGNFIGVIDQVPPAYSAAQVSGRRAHALARHGIPVALKPRRVHIHAIEIRHYEYPCLEVEIRCGGGTYVRSLARDLGAHLGCGGYIQSLRRTKVGPFGIEGALKLDELRSIPLDRLLPLEAATVGLPQMVLSPDCLAELRQGKSLTPMQASGLPTGGVDTEFAVMDLEGNLAALAVWRSDLQRLHPRKVFI